MLVSIFDTSHCTYYRGVVVRTFHRLISPGRVILSVSSFQSVEVVGRFLIPDPEGGPGSTQRSDGGPHDSPGGGERVV
jgi:hypothetical protein